MLFFNMDCSNPAKIPDFQEARSFDLLLVEISIDDQVLLDNRPLSDIGFPKYCKSRGAVS